MLKFNLSHRGVNVIRKTFCVAAALFLAGSLGAGDWAQQVNSAVQSQKKGDLKTAERTLLKALLAAENFGEKDPRTAYTLDYLGTVYQQQGQSDEALAVFARAHDGFAKSLGPDSSEAVESGHRLADAYAAAEKWSKAEPLYRDLLDRERARKPADPLALASACTDLGLSLDAQSQWDSALKLYKEAQALREKALGPDAAEVAETLNNQGRIALLRGDLKQAETLIRRALAIDEKALGEGHPAVADDLRRLSAVLFKAGKTDESKALGDRAEKLDNDRQPAPRPQRLGGER
jgi:tetratricopeptide (TPR) repeat protein